MKQTHIQAMKARQRAEKDRRFTSYKLADIPSMGDDELADFVEWLGVQMRESTGSRYAYLDLLQDMAINEQEKRWR